MIAKRVARSVLIGSCLLLASCNLLRDTMQVTREVEVPVEVTRIVENLVEVTKIVEIPVEVTKLVIKEKEVTREVTRVVEVVIEVTAEAGPTKRPTNTPQPAPTSQPAPTDQPQVPSSTESAKQMDQSLRRMGGMIDSALRSGVLGCSEWVAEWDLFMSIPTSVPETQFAHDHLNNWSEMTDNCRDFLTNDQGGTIPFQQWGTIRQAINEALERIRPLVEG